MREEEPVAVRARLFCKELIHSIYVHSYSCLSVWETIYCHVLYRDGLKRRLKFW